MAVLLHGGAAAGGVDDDGIDVGLLEGGDDLAGHGGGLAVEAGVEHEGAAAGLAGGDDDLAVLGGEHAGGGAVDAAEEDLLDAAGEHADAAAGRVGRHESGGEFGGEGEGDAGEEGLHGGEAFGKEAEEAGGAHETLEAGALVEEHGKGEEAEAAGVGEDGKEEFAEEAVGERAGDVALHLAASVLDELVVLDAGGAGGHAGHAAETVVHVGAEGGVEGSLGLPGLAHHVDAAAGGVHLFAPEDVGGAGGKAEAAVDTIFDELALGRIVGVEVRGMRCFDLHQVGHFRGFRGDVRG